MELVEVFKSPFILQSWKPIGTQSQAERFEFSTEEIEDTTTLEELYILSKPFLNLIVEEYNKSQISGKSVKGTFYNLFISIWNDTTKKQGHHRLYTVFYNTTTGAIKDEIKFNEPETFFFNGPMLWKRKEYHGPTPIQGKFKICINVEVYTFEDEDEELYKSPFKSIPFYSPKSIFKIPEERFLFNTDEIQASTTTEEIYKFSQKYLKSIVEEYNQSRINGKRVKQSTYNLYLDIWEEDRKQWKEKILYNVFYNIEENKIIHEENYYNNLDNIEGKFIIGISVGVYILE